MFAEKNLVVYKGKPALVMALGEKIEIRLPGGESLRVREKDIALIHPGPAGPAFPGEAGQVPPAEGDVRGAWELLQGTAVPLRELAELAFGEYSPGSAWAAWLLLQDGLYFAGDLDAITAREADAVAEEETRREGRRQEARERELFLERLRSKAPLLPEDGRFLQDAEALAGGSGGKSRTLKELGRPETPVEAHRLLLSAGVWDEWVNPYPGRFGLSPASPREPVAPPPSEARRELAGIRAYAIDNSYSADPDDAVSLEGPDGSGRLVVSVHVADPAASVLPGSPADIEARGRGATLYLPEGPSRMLAPEALSHYALGLTRRSPALTFRMTLDGRGDIEETEIFPSLAEVTRLTYADADRIAAGEAVPGAAGGTDSDALRRDLAALIAFSEANMRRRVEAGAVMIDLPEVHLSVDREKRRIFIEQNIPGPAALMVRECMLLAGEGAARWASRRQLPFPFVCQETGEIPRSVLPGMAGAYQLRRCMRPRVLSVKPGLHWGLGLDQYSQVTSPLRRYGDLLAHQQIRAALGLPGAGQPLSAGEMTLALGAGEAAYQATVQAERASRAHWTAVYLAERRESLWEGVVLERKGGRALVMIPALGIETQVSVKNGEEPNDVLRLALVSVRIPEAETVFSVV